MINEEWNKTQNDAPFVAFYNIHAVMFVLPDEMADVLIAGLQWFILITHPTCCNPTNYNESSHSSLILVISYDMLIPVT